MAEEVEMVELAGLEPAYLGTLPERLPEINLTAPSSHPSVLFGGGGGIRTHEAFTPARFKVGCHYPKVGHSSVTRSGKAEEVGLESTSLERGH